MNSPSWKDSVFFLSYDEGGGPLDHVPPVPNHTNDFTDKSLGITTDISVIAVNPDSYSSPRLDLVPPVYWLQRRLLRCTAIWKPVGLARSANDVDTPQGFAAQLGFRLPNMVVSPFTRSTTSRTYQWITPRCSSSSRAVSSVRPHT